MATYKDSGVDIEAGDLAVERMAHYVKSTHSPKVLTRSHGGFAGMFLLDYPKGLLRREYRDPVLMACTDGVGTKLEVAIRMGISDTVGIDLVGMCVNDLIVQGAEPLFFLDYIAVGKLDPEQVAGIVKGIAKGCRECECSILGGETAEMPGFYPPGHYDIAGFSVGVAERSRIVDGSRVAPGDVILGVASSGLHSNGYSLARQVLLKGKKPQLDRFDDRLGCTLGEELLRPTRLYPRPVLSILRRYRHKKPVHAMAHITGGGLVGNVPRVLPPGLDAVIRKSSWEAPPIFDLIREKGKVSEAEMFRVFNMGIGLAVVVSPHFASSILHQFNRAGFPTWRIGEIIAGARGKSRVKMRK